MKVTPKKIFIGSLIAFFLSISCCWISALTIWLGGATVITSLATYFDQLQYAIIGIALFLGITSLVLFLKEKKRIR